MQNTPERAQQLSAPSNNLSELFGILQSRINEQDKKLSALLEICHLQNRVLAACKSTKANHADLIAEANHVINITLVQSLRPVTPAKKADTEAA